MSVEISGNQVVESGEQLDRALDKAERSIERFWNDYDLRRADKEWRKDVL